ncbi:hypothetical protein [Nostoc sp. MG11]|uniref:hypothetical protein n=1 Tax=Nostoc sp. MG11 TaxID=2721166 RepID=UPI001865C03A|nr:hypothetical protein [Nostoc sp. MG11]
MHCFATSNPITAPAVALDVIKTGYGNGRGNVSVELQMLHKRDRSVYFGHFEIVFTKESDV